MNEQAETNPQPTIEELVKSAETLKFIGEHLLQSQVNGYEAGRLWESVAFVQQMFSRVDQDIKSHPGFQTRLDEIQKKKDDQLEKQRDLADRQPKGAASIEMG